MRERTNLWNRIRNKISIEQIACGSYRLALEELYKNKEIAYAKRKEGIFLGKFRKEDLIDIYRLERIAYEFWYTTACKRRLFKGGELTINEDEYYVRNDDTTDKLLYFYDNRKQNFKNRPTLTGILLQPNNYGNINGVTFIPKYNVERESLNDYPFHKIFNLSLSKDEFETPENSIPNFIWFPFDFDYYYQANFFLKDEFKEHFGFSFECFVVSLYLIIRQAILFCFESKRPLVGVDLIKRAYRHMSLKEGYITLLVDLSKNYKLPSLPDYELNLEEMKIFFDYFKALEKGQDTISLTTLGPRKLFIPSFDNGFIIDYAAILFILITQTSSLNGNEELKGYQFEDVVIKQLKDEGINLWECKKILKHQDGTSKEIDISFYYKNVLFIAELKCNKMSLAFTLIGSEDALKFRQTKIQKALNQVNKKALWLKTHFKGTNYCIPDEVNVVVPIVVSPFGEYIWTTDESFWITEEIPRVCLPSELPQLLTEKVLIEVIKKPYSIFLKK